MGGAAGEMENKAFNLKLKLTEAELGKKFVQFYLTPCIKGVKLPIW